MSHYNNGYSGLAIADYFIEKANSEKKNITNMHVLKMIYFAQAYSFSVLKRNLINDDFYAWKWGPVELKTYECFKKHGSEHISHPSGVTDRELSDIKKYESITSFLDTLYNGLIDLNPFALSELTHVPKGPWFITPFNEVINKNTISSYYGNRK